MAPSRFPGRCASLFAAVLVCASLSAAALAVNLKTAAVKPALPVGTCVKSTLKGYKASVVLSPGKLNLHWISPKAGTTNFAIEAPIAGGASGGWVSVGWSQAGKMFPADAVVGNLAGTGTATVKTYVMTSYLSTAVKTTSAFKLTGQSSTTNANGTVVAFSRSGTSGKVAVKHGKANNIIWAFSAAGTKAFSAHNTTTRGALVVNLGCVV